MMTTDNPNTPLMSRIEMVMHLQSVDLFRSCAATEAVRLAQIAQLVELEQDAVVYRTGDAAKTLYTVVQGQVLIDADNGQRRVIGPRQAFGVAEVLSGRQHGTLAQAGEPTLVLSITGDDFFDLLSNNINIVKALFREVLAGTTAGEPSGQHAVPLSVSGSAGSSSSSPELVTESAGLERRSS